MVFIGVYLMVVLEEGKGGRISYLRIGCSYVVRVNDEIF